jgi:O-antigen ligase
LIAITISLSRSALVAGFILVAGAMIVGAPRHRMRSLIVAVLVVSTGYWAITFWAPLHDRFFSGDVSLSIGGVDVNAEGRTAVWRVLWSEVPNDWVFGHGPGAASAASVQIDPTFDQPHNDYLRLIYDFGVVGMGLLAWFSLRVTRSLKRAIQHGPPSVAPLAACYAGLAILILMITDNPLDYPFVMIPLGTLIGLGLGAGVSHRVGELSAPLHGTGATRL